MMNFTLARLPRIIFGSGVIDQLPQLVAGFGRHTLLITGAESFTGSVHWPALLQAFEQQDIQWRHGTVAGEPSPELVDSLVAQFRAFPIDSVVGIGGGSALDAAKAVAGLLKIDHSVMDFLEGVGPELPYPGPAVPLIAVPTTAGTGSEATKNAVLSRHGAQGFKKSFRDEQLVAQFALLDPRLLSSCTADIIAANGMDALTQLIESYVSLKANAFTDALAISGLRSVRDALLPWYQAGAEAEDALREKMAYAALLSGITLAQVGLGSVHGLASPLGAFFPIPHGVVCGTLVAAASATNIQAMLSREPDNPALAKYARLGEVLCQRRFANQEQAWQGLQQQLQIWTEQMDLPGLGRYGLTQQAIANVVAHSRGSSMKTNPIVLTDAELTDLITQRL